MNCNISSSKFDNPFLGELLQTLSDYFRTADSEFFVIGATARDIILSNIFNEPARRKTADLDIAIAIPDWDRFEQISSDLTAMDCFEKSQTQKQRFIFKGEYVLDIVTVIRMYTGASPFFKSLFLAIKKSTLNLSCFIPLIFVVKLLTLNQ